MVDYTSARRSSTARSLTSLGFAPSGSPSGSPWPTGAFSYAPAAQGFSGGSEIYAQPRLRGSGVLGATGPLPTGAGQYVVDAASTDTKDVPSRQMSNRPRSNYPVGTSYFSGSTGGGLYSASGAGSPVHESDSAYSVAVPLPVTSTDVAVTYYRLRARDSAGPLNNPARFVYWTSDVLSLASYQGSLPFGGPLVELTTLSTWTA